MAAAAPAVVAWQAQSRQTGWGHSWRSASVQETDAAQTPAQEPAIQQDAVQLSERLLELGEEPGMPRDCLGACSRRLETAAVTVPFLPTSNCSP